MTACHKFRPIDMSYLCVNVDEFNSLKGSSEPSNATGTTFSVVNYESESSTKKSLHTQVCSIRAPVASYRAVVSTAAGILVHEDTCRTLPFTKCFSTVVGTATHWHLQNSLKLYLLHSA